MVSVLPKYNGQYGMPGHTNSHIHMAGTTSHIIQNGIMCGLHRMFRLLPAQYIISLLHGFLIKATMSQQSCTPLKHTHTLVTTIVLLLIYKRC